MSFRITTISALDGLATTKKFPAIGRALITYKELVAKGWWDYIALYELKGDGRITRIIARQFSQ